MTSNVGGHKGGAGGCLVTPPQHKKMKITFLLTTSSLKKFMSNHLFQNIINYMNNFMICNAVPTAFCLDQDSYPCNTC